MYLIKKDNNNEKIVLIPGCFHHVCQITIINKHKITSFLPMFDPNFMPFNAHSSEKFHVTKGIENPEDLAPIIEAINNSLSY